MIRTTEEFRLMVKAARRVGTPLVAVRTADPASAIAHVTASVNGKNEETPLVAWDFVSGLQGRNEAGKSALAKVLGESSPALAPGDVLALAGRIAADAIISLNEQMRIIVFNDGAFDYATDRDRRADTTIELEHGKPETARAWIDGVIPEWFSAPQQDLHGDAPRDVIWRERRGEPNILSKDHQHEAFFDDCPICQAMQGLGDVGEWHWGFDDGGNPLIAEYDPKGWDAFWSKDVDESGPSARDQGDFGPDEWNTDKTDFSMN